jgi:predicted SprT family Zn-dependent metalloprotease
MPKKEAPLEYLEKFLPGGSAGLVLQYLHDHKVHLTITRERKTLLGDYRHATRSSNHRISVNGSLNAYSFLITLIHELGHLITFNEFGNQVASHGREWKKNYRHVLEDFIRLHIFPEDILVALKKSLHNLPATSCGDEDLLRVLRKYDRNPHGLVMVEQVVEGSLFRIESGKIFKKGKKIRKRFQCEEVDSGRIYLFSPVYEVKVV